MTTSNGSNLAVLYAFTISLIVCANIPYGMFVFAPFWAAYTYRRMASSPHKEKDQSEC